MIHVQVSRLEMDAPRLAVGNGMSGAVVWAAPASGLREKGWQPRTETRVGQSLAAQKGGGELDASSLPCLISESAVPHLGAEGVHGVNPDALLPAVQTIDIEPQGKAAAVVLPLPLHLPGGQPCALPIALLTPSVHAFSVALNGINQSTPQREGRSGVPLFRVPRAFSHLAKLTRVPLMARRAVLPTGTDMVAAFVAERRALAAACGAAVEEVKLLASFPHVPLSLVQQMAVTPDGNALRLWLRPESLAAGAGWTAARVTIVIGRRRSTGETIRAVLPDLHGTERR